jgi:glutamate racemase
LTNRVNQPIGIFDSGIGGLTIARAIAERLPNEEIIYFGDTAHMPYGDKSADAIRYYCLRIARFLLEKGCKMIVIACNSASSAAYPVLLDFFRGETLFVNVVDPLVAEVARKNYQKVGIIATKATINSRVYELKLLEKRPKMDIRPLATPLLAPMIEEGFFENELSSNIIKTYLENPKLAEIDALLLACTHYPLIHAEIDAFFQQKVEILDSTRVTAEAVAQKLAEHQLLNDKKRQPHQFYVSDFTKSFEETTRIFWPEKINLEACPIW